MFPHRIAITLGLGLALTACAALSGPAQRAEKTIDPTVLGSTPSGAYLSARHAQNTRDNTRAADLYARALAFSPDNPELLRRSFSSMASEGRIDEAAALAMRMKKEQINIQMATLVLAVHAAKNNRYSQAEAELATLPDSGFNNFISPLLQAWSKAARGDTAAALKALKPMEETRGFEAFSNLHSALILDLAGDNAAAGERYNTVIAGAGTFIRAVQAVASFYARNGQVDRARDIYRNFEATNPESGLGRVGMAELASGIKPERVINNPHEGMAEALFDLASLLHQQNLDEVALVLDRLALYLQPEFDIAELLVADIMENNGQGEKAVAIYETLPATSPFGWPARLRAAAVLDDLGRTDEAVARLDVMANDQPKRVDALVTMGDILRSRERFGEAVGAYDRAFERITKLDKRHWGLLYARGISLERTKQWERAESDFVKALEFNPDQPYLLNYLGYSWVERGVHLDQALKLIEKAVKLRPEDGYIVDSMGWVLYMLGSYDGAVTNLERAAELKPQDPVINDHLGDAYWQVGRQMEARFQWRRALSLKPEPDLSRSIEEKLARGLTDQKAVRGSAQGTTSAPVANNGQGI
jgi:tetratricopeptide (TPR) repeat protein